MENEKKYWTDVIGERLRNGEQEAPEELWNAIANRVGTTVPPTPLYRRRWVGYGASVAAMVTLGLFFTMLFDIDKVDDSVVADSIKSVKSSVDTIKREIESASVVTKPIKSVIVAQNIPQKPISTVDPMEIETPEIYATWVPSSEPSFVDSGSVVEQAPKSNNVKDSDTNKADVKDKRKVYTLPLEDENSGMGGFSLALNAGGGAASSISSSTVNTMPRMMSSSVTNPDGSVSMKPGAGVSQIIVEEEPSYQHHQPITFALVFSKNIGKGFSAGAGVTYSVLRSTETKSHSDKSIDQKLQFVGIPVHLSYDFVSAGDFSAYLGVQAQAEKCVSAKYGEHTIKENEIQLSGSVLAGAQYNITDNLAIYAEPQLSHYFTKTDLRTIRNDKKAVFNLQFGLKFTY